MSLTYCMYTPEMYLYNGSGAVLNDFLFIFIFVINHFIYQLSLLYPRELIAPSQFAFLLIIVFLYVLAFAARSEAYFSALSKIGEKAFHTMSSRSLGTCKHILVQFQYYPVETYMRKHGGYSFMYNPGWENCIHDHLLNKLNKVYPIMMKLLPQAAILKLLKPSE